MRSRHRVVLVGSSSAEHPYAATRWRPRFLAPPREQLRTDF